MNSLAAPELPTIASFWFGSDLTWLERLCIQSFLDQGHQFVLYTAEQIDGVPSGAEVRDASEILWPPAFDISDNDRLKVAVFSDVFRLYLIRQTGCIWADLDAYCVRPFRFASPYVFGVSKQGKFPNGVMGLPAHSATLEAMLGFVTSSNPSQPWRGGRLQRLNRKRVDAGETWGIESLPWGCSGPKAFEYFLCETGENKHALPPETFYPLDPKELWMLHNPKIHPREIEQDGVHSVHIYGHQKRVIAKTMNGVPTAGSYLHHLCERHQITPSDHPVVRLNWM